MGPRVGFVEEDGASRHDAGNNELSEGGSAAGGGPRGRAGPSTGTRTRASKRWDVSLHSVSPGDRWASAVLLESVVRRWPAVGRGLMRAVERGLQGLALDADASGKGGMSRPGPRDTDKAKGARSSGAGGAARLPIRVQCVAGAMLSESGSGSRWNRQEAEAVADLVHEAIVVRGARGASSGSAIGEDASDDSKVSVSVVTPYSMQ